MYSRSRLAQKYLRYYLTASNGRGHGIHSPFVFDFVKKILNDRKVYAAWSRIEGLRRELEQDKTLLEIVDLGAGSVLQATRYRSIASLARHAAKPRKLGRLLSRLARYYQPKTILELGTSLGLSSSYLASGATDAKLYTIEGADSVAAIAERNFRTLELRPELVRGNFDQQIGPVLDRMGRVDMAFIDGNHRKEPTLRYFNALMERVTPSSVLIFDDIHWSHEMEEAWELIRADSRVFLTIDLFFIGLVFIRDEFKIKQHFTIRF
jgi:predicted O-methyltransferase YrrM